MRFFLGRLRFLHRDSRFCDACRYANARTQQRFDRAFDRAQRRGGAEPESTEKEPGQEEEELESGGGSRRLGGDVGGERYVVAHELAKRTEDRDAVRQELLNVFFAAHDGAAIALTSIVFDLARHPAVWARLREEVLGFGDAPVTF